jgi:hypothetical protein
MTAHAQDWCETLGRSATVLAPFSPAPAAAASKCIRRLAQLAAAGRAAYHRGKLESTEPPFQSFSPSYFLNESHVRRTQHATPPVRPSTRRPAHTHTHTHTLATLRRMRPPSAQQSRSVYETETPRDGGGAREYEAVVYNNNNTTTTARHKYAYVVARQRQRDRQHNRRTEHPAHPTRLSFACAPTQEPAAPPPRQTHTHTNTHTHGPTPPDQRADTRPHTPTHNTNGPG